MKVCKIKAATWLTRATMMASITYSRTEAMLRETEGEYAEAAIVTATMRATMKPNIVGVY